MRVDSKKRGLLRSTGLHFHVCMGKVHTSEHNPKSERRDIYMKEKFARREERERDSDDTLKKE